MAMVSLVGVKPGDVLLRRLDVTIPVLLTVTYVDEVNNLVFCGDWTFDRLTGAEVDHELNWGPEYGYTGSYITAVNPQLEGAHTQ